MSRLSILQLVSAIALTGLLSIIIIFLLFRPTKVPFSAIKVILPIEYKINHIKM